MDNKGKLPRVIVNPKANSRRLSKPEQAQADEKVREARSDSTAVGVSLNGWEIQALDLMLGMIPEVREAQVKKFQKKIAAGTYHVSAEQIADKIIDAYSSKS
jgi:flagellar biosynthesis anti-sigma factor FlgM